jgi:pyruvate dehydrogenase E1 component alpha subunit
MIETINKVINFSKFSKKPAFIEIKNFRYLEHCGPNYDDNLNYRSNREISFWKKNDAVFILEKYLVKLDKTFNHKKFKDSFIKFVNRIFRKIYMNNKPNKINLKNFVYKKT